MYRSSRRSYRSKRRYVRRPVKKRSTNVKKFVRKLRARRFKRRTLNISTRKKQDTMVAWKGDLDGDPSSGSTTVGPDADTTSHYFLWGATMRPTADGIGSTGTVSERSTRTATDVYIKGLADSMLIQCGDGTPWEWRRIVFSAYGPQIWTGPAGSFPPWHFDISAGVVRLMADLNTTADALAIRAQVASLVFKGTQGADWSDEFIAKLDNGRIKIHYDKYRKFQSGNDLGSFHRYRDYIPINKRLVYDDDETGPKEQSSIISATRKDSVGDIYVLDIVRMATNTEGGASTVFQMTPNADLYWHER